MLSPLLLRSRHSFLYTFICGSHLWKVSIQKWDFINLDWNSSLIPWKITKFRKENKIWHVLRICLLQGQLSITLHSHSIHLRNSLPSSQQLDFQQILKNWLHLVKMSLNEHSCDANLPKAFLLLLKFATEWGKGTVLWIWAWPQTELSQGPPLWWQDWPH